VNQSEAARIAAVVAIAGLSDFGRAVAAVNAGKPFWEGKSHGKGRAREWSADDYRAKANRVARRRARKGYK
jgi:hypothetical protein